MSYHGRGPFWESDDEIDVGIISDILVVIYRNIPEEESIPIFRNCLDQSRSCAVKMCAVRALTLLSIEVCSRVDYWLRADSPIHLDTQNTLAAFIGQSTRDFSTSRPLRSYRRPCPPLTNDSL